MDVGLSFNLQIVKRYFRRVAGIKPGSAALEVFLVCNPIDILAVDVEGEFRTTRAHLQLIGIGAGPNDARSGPRHYGRLLAAFVLDNFILRLCAGVDEQRLVLELVRFGVLAMHDKAKA